MKILEVRGIEVEGIMMEMRRKGKVAVVGVEVAVAVVVELILEAPLLLWILKMRKMKIESEV